MSTINIRNARARKPEWSMAEPVNFTLEEGEHIAIIGRNGSGKSMFVDILTGRHPAFPEIDEETPTVGSKLEEAYKLAGEDTPERRALQQHIYELFQLEPLLDKYIILLSSGELRKYKLASSLFTNPKVLIMENPFIGLDANTRDQLKALMTMLAKEQGLQMILVLAKTDEIPDFITHIVEVKDMKVLPKVENKPPKLGSDRGLNNRIFDSSDPQPPNLGGSIIRFNHVTIKYGERTILKDLDWTVHQGEHWSLSGQNGSGKSTLLSLVQNIPALQIVASGLKDSVGLYVRPTEAEKEQCRKWLTTFGVGDLADRRFMEMSSGEQRLVLLARAFVKEPDLLILDEPLHGLDDLNRRMVKDLVDEYCKNPAVTLIYVTHYQEELPHCIDHALFLERH